MTAPLDPAREAARLRDLREAFELAMARGIPLAEARRALVDARWAEADRRLDARRRCGTVADAGEASRSPTFWWMRD